MSRLLLLTTGLYFDPADKPTRLRYETLSQAGFTGQILCVLDHRQQGDLSIGNFSLSPLYLPPMMRGYGTITGILRALYYSMFCAWTGIRRRNQYDVCIAADTFKVGALSYIISVFTKKPYILEVAGNYIRSYDVDASKKGVVARLKQSYVRKVSPVILRHASAIKLLYDAQIDELATVDDREKIFVFHDTTALDEFHPSSLDGKYILSIGHPWHLKGMDVLIKAFNLIQDDIPDYKLCIVGYCPDMEEFERLAGSNPRIIFHNKGMEYDQVIESFLACSVFVLASRTEAMGRVLLEAMASRKPIIASRVDGIPYVIRDGQNGLLFESENVDELAEKLRLVLTDGEYAGRLAESGLRDVYERFSHQRFIDKYRDMVQYALGS